MGKICESCRTNKAEVPDRERMGRPIKRICKPCHADRLRGDILAIMARRENSPNNRKEGI